MSYLYDVLFGYLDGLFWMVFCKLVKIVFLLYFVCEVGRYEYSMKIKLNYWRGVILYV